MHRILSFILGICLLLVSMFSHAAEPKIEANKAPFYVGKTVMACGDLVEIKATRDKTYLNLDKKYPSQSLSILIFEDNLKKLNTKFGDLNTLQNRRLCIRGEINEYKDNLQIIVNNENNLRLMH